MKRFAVAAIAASLLVAGSAQADLNGTMMDLEVSHTGAFGFTESGTLTYGGADTVIADPGFPQFFMVFSSPGTAPGFMNAIQVDFTDFAYGDFAGETGSLDITGIDEQVEDGSVVILNEGGAKIATGTNGSDSLSLTWNVDDVLNSGSGTLMTVAWNSVIPTPGALALLGMAGVAGRRRRRD